MFFGLTPGCWHWQKTEFHCSHLFYCHLSGRNSYINCLIHAYTMMITVSLSIVTLNFIQGSWKGPRIYLGVLEGMTFWHVFLILTNLASFRRDSYSAKPFEGLKFVDVGCGGGILSEVHLFIILWQYTIFQLVYLQLILKVYSYLWELSVPWVCGLWP